MELLKKTPKNLENAKQISQSTEIAHQAQLLREYCHVHASNKKVFSRVELVLAQCSATLGGEGGTCYMRTSLLCTLQSKHILLQR